jgi:hypothetical protein
VLQKFVEEWLRLLYVIRRAGAFRPEEYASGSDGSKEKADSSVRSE